MDNKPSSKWDDVYAENSGILWYPDEGLVKFSARYLKRSTGIDMAREKKRDDLMSNTSILDVGCGTGRHVVFFAEQGFTVSGIDHSKNAIKTAEEWLKAKNLSANVSVSTIDNIQFNDNSFNVVISMGVFDHVFF